MGGHGGLNILPQKRWNVYNYDNREKVRKDEEAAAKEEQLRREQSRKHDSGFRLEKLRQARGLSSSSSKARKSLSPPPPPESESKHINLFQGIRIFDPVDGKTDQEEDRKGNPSKKMRKEEAPRVVTAEDEKYRLGYGVAGKGVKLPWYMVKPSMNDKGSDDGDDSEDGDRGKSARRNSGGKKSLEELREERLRRESKEKERERALLMEKSRRQGRFSSRR